MREKRKNISTKRKATGQWLIIENVTEKGIRKIMQVWFEKVKEMLIKYC